MVRVWPWKTMGSFIVVLVPAVAVAAEGGGAVVPLDELGRSPVEVVVEEQVIVVVTVAAIVVPGVEDDGTTPSSPVAVDDDEATTGTTGIGIESLDPEPS